MRSKAHFKSHPIHPILVGFPIAFFTGALITDVLLFFVENPVISQFGFYLVMAGIVSGLIAAVPGIIDYMYTLPQGSSAKKRGTTHALFNSSAIICFVISVVFRNSDEVNHYSILAVDIAGMILLTFGGWHGGTLVYRNQIGVDIRYAGAGKWKEEHFDKNEKKLLVARTNELQNNQMKLIHAGDKRIVVCFSEGKYAAFDDHCSHRGGALSGGALICGTVQCSWHGSQFDVFTGEVKEGPAKQNIRTYTIVEEGDKIFLEL